MDISKRNLERVSKLAKKAQAKTTSNNERQKNTVIPDFFLPNIYDIRLWDSVSLMDIAIFRLSKRDKQTGVCIRYDFRNGDYVEIKSGPDGMATIWDYDIVLMMISHLTESMNQYRQNKIKLPSRVLNIQACDILKFCQKGCGSRQYDEIEMALDRLKNTTIKTVRHPERGGRVTRITESEGLISRYKVESRTKAEKIAKISIEIPNWIYQEITQGSTPHVLTISPEYFSISSRIAKFIYRLACKAAGTRPARWGFRTLYERSFSTGNFNTFNQLLRKIIKNNDLPEFYLQEEQGKNREPQLLIQRKK